ncbi:MAG: DNA primase [Chloroflexi bacterium]|nr:DNA primase [Chloroflexota bacterium]
MAGSPVEEVKARLDLVEIVGSSVPLKRAGSSYKGLCPFHAEKTPSFYVFPETQTWKCFGCGAGGDVFTFVMQRDGLAFAEALRALAARAGVALDAPRDTAREQADARLRQALEAAALYYHALLMQHTLGAAARRYLDGRGITVETRERFLLGYAPDSPAALTQHLLEQGFHQEEIVTAGLAVAREEREGAGPAALRDRFRHRLMFPIRDAQGRTIGFGGRTLQPDGVPKYLNSPQTPLFDKGAHLYALDLARDAIRAARQAVIVEGYVDAVMAHQAGFRNVVAALGTALSARQLAPLGRLAEDIVFALDPDAAGQQATLRSLVVARQALATPVPLPAVRGGRAAERAVHYRTTAAATLRVARLPEGQDPDDLIRAAPERWRALIDGAPPVLDFLLDQVPGQYDLATPRGKQLAVEALVPTLRDVADDVERAHYAQRLAAIVGLPDSVIEDLARPPTRVARPQPATTVVRPDRLEEYALALITLGAPSGGLAEADLARGDCRALLAWLQAGGAAGGPPLPDELATTWASVQALVEENRLLSPAQLREELDNTALELRKRRVVREWHEIESLVRGSADGPAPELAERLAHLAAQRRQLELAQAARGRVVASTWRFPAAKEVRGDS